jgi:nucleotide-binding universal stress UspA family protein
MDQYQSIVVAVDGSKEAEYAFRKSIDAAKRNEGSTLNIVNVVDTKLFEAYDQTSIESARQTSEELLNDYKAQAEASGLTDVRTVVEYGSPQTVITNEISDAAGADLIVCGAKGHSAIERFLLGSVSEAIMRSARCDVLVVRTPE